MGMFNDPLGKNLRKSLRKNMPKAEVALWSKLKSRNLLGYKFRRQHGIGKYIVDFYCPELKLAIEVDGDSHFHEKRLRSDPTRQQFIEELGISILRFTNMEIYKNLEGVLKTIEDKARRKRQTFPFSLP